MELSENAKIAVGCAITAIVTAGVGWLIATSSAGMDAAERARIETIIDEKLETDGGSNVKAELVEVNTKLTRIETQIGYISTAVDALAASQNQPSPPAQPTQ